MELNYSLNENDFLQYQLYAASKSRQIKKSRNKSITVFIILCIFFSVLFYLMNNEIPSFFILISLIIISGLYFQTKKRYINYYKKFIEENYKERIGLPCKMIFADTELIAKDYLSESKVKYESFSQINEIKDYYFLKIKTEQSFIVPKRVIINDADFLNMLKVLQTEYQIILNQELDWKWK